MGMLHKYTINASPPRAFFPKCETPTCTVIEFSIKWSFLPATLHRYMKYLYPYECERKGLSSPGELQAAIDSNRREGRRPSYSSSLFRFSPSPSTAPHILSPPKMHLSALGAGTSGALNGLQASPVPSLKKGTRHAGRIRIQLSKHVVSLDFFFSFYSGLPPTPQVQLRFERCCNRNHNS